MSFCEEGQFRPGDADLLLHQIGPVIISVTGCSTWSRVFISMK